MNESRPIRRTAILVFWAVFACYLSLSPATVGGRGYVDEEVVSGNLMLANFNAWVKHRPSVPMFWSRQGPLPVLLDLPFIKLGKLIVSTDFIMSFQPVVLTAALVTILFVWLRKVASPGVSLLLTLAGAFGTMLWPYAYIGLETKQSLFILLAGYLALARGKIRGWPRLVAFAIICGVAVNLKYTGFASLPAIGCLVYAQFRDDWRLRRRQALGVLIIIGSLCALNVLGQKFFWNTYGENASNFNQWIAPSPFLMISNFVGLFGSPMKSLFLFAPIVAVSIWAIPRAWRDRARRDNRDIALYALLVTVGTASLLSIFIHGGVEETWGPRYMHIAIAPLLVCIGAAWPRLEWKKHLPMAALALLGVVVSFLGAFHYYGTRLYAIGEAHQNTLQWMIGDPLWNEIAFDARAFSVWYNGGKPTPWSTAHIWVWDAPPGAQPWKTIDLKVYCNPQSILLQFWSLPKQGTVLTIFRIFLASLIMGAVLLFLVVIRAILAERRFSQG
jgi:hypothetical protein